jgi:hypothetical protein
MNRSDQKDVLSKTTCVPGGATTVGPGSDVKIGAISSPTFPKGMANAGDAIEKGVGAIGGGIAGTFGKVGEGMGNIGATFPFRWGRKDRDGDKKE